MNDRTLKRLRARYKKGMRVELSYMDDKQAPPIGTRGTIVGIDDAGSIMTHWDNGSSLSLLEDADDFCIVYGPTTVCYGEKRNWKTMDEALEFFLVGMMNSDGSERDRYARVYSKLKSGSLFATDE